MPTILLVLALQTQVTGSIFGVVRDTAARPLADAVVSIAGMTRHTRSDSLGQYRLVAVPAGPTNIAAWALGYKTTIVGQMVDGGRRLHLDFELHALGDEIRPVGSVFGVVRDTAGHPIQGAMVFVNATRHKALTDSLGQYRIDSVPARAIQLVARSLGYLGTSVDTAVAAEEVVQLNFVMRISTVRLYPLVSDLHH